MADRVALDRAAEALYESDYDGERLWADLPSGQRQAWSNLAALGVSAYLGSLVEQLPEEAIQAVLSATVEGRCPGATFQVVGERDEAEAVIRAFLLALADPVSDRGNE